MRAKLSDASGGAVSVDEESFPLIDDVGMAVARKYGMIMPGEDSTKAVRAVFVIDPAGIIRAIIYYPLPLHLQGLYATLGMGEGSLPVAEQAGREVLSLPMYPELTAAQQEQVVAAIAEFYG